ncbi:MAG: AI-2E family transporter [Firmicutes bacterium]|nr:AI-2E family transporter [Bacillota bacterium]
MNKFFKSRMMKSMIPYFILILGAILIFRLTAEFRFFSDIVARFWFIISPFLAGAIVAYVLNLPCGVLQRLIERLKDTPVPQNNRPLKATVNFIVRKSRAFSVFLLIILTILIVTLILNILIPAVINSVALFVEESRNYEVTIREWIDRVNQRDLPDFIAEHINEDAIISSLLGWAANLDFNAMWNSVIAGFGGFAMALFRGFLAMVASLYLLVEKDKLKAFVIRLISALTSESTNNTILKYSGKLDFNFRQYIFAQTIDGIILGSIMTVVLFAFGSPYALVLGLILGIVNYIPYFGSIFGTALALLVVAFTQGMPTALVALPIMFAIQQFDGNFIQPKLMGKTFALSPLLVIISVTIGMNYGGILGMLVAIPIVAILKDVLNGYIAYREENKDKPQISDNDFMDRDIW